MTLLIPLFRCSIVLESPLLAYFKPEGDEVRRLQGTNLKEIFYSYLVDYHSTDSQIVIIENQHPPDSVLNGLRMFVFTGNPNEWREGFLYPSRTGTDFCAHRSLLQIPNQPLKNIVLPAGIGRF